MRTPYHHHLPVLLFVLCFFTTNTHASVLQVFQGWGNRCQQSTDCPTTGFRALEFRCIFHRCMPAPKIHFKSLPFIKNAAGTLKPLNTTEDITAGIMSSQFAYETYRRGALDDRISSGGLCDAYTLIDSHSADVVNKHGHRFAVYEGPNDIVMAFRGTKDNRDALIDIQFWQSSVPHDGCGKVHRGFRRAFTGFRVHLDWIASRLPQKPVVITGHSLGGALATLATLYLTVQHPHVNITGMSTFGSPRVGDREFAKCFIKEVYGKHPDVVMRRYVLVSSDLYEHVGSWWDPVAVVPNIDYQHVVAGTAVKCRNNIAKCLAGKYHSLELYMDSLVKYMDEDMGRRQCGRWPSEEGGSEEDSLMEMAYFEGRQPPVAQRHMHAGRRHPNWKKEKID